jgi:hypothetical protein
MMNYVVRAGSTPYRASKQAVAAALERNTGENTGLVDCNTFAEFWTHLTARLSKDFAKRCCTKNAELAAASTTVNVSSVPPGSES